MELCKICDNNPSSDKTQCQNGHIICDECYDKVSVCPYCRWLYNVNLYDQSENISNQSQTSETSDDEGIHICPQCQSLMKSEVIGLDRLENLESTIKKIHHYTFTYPDSDSDSDVDSESEHERLCGIDHEFAHVLMSVFKAYYENDRLLVETLPISVKLYLESLIPDEKNLWIAQLRQCFKNVVVAFSKGYHLKIFPPEQDTGEYLFNYMKMHSCVGDEYIMHKIITEAYGIYSENANAHNPLTNSSDFYCLDDEFFYKKALPPGFHPRRASLKKWFVKFSDEDVMKLLGVSRVE
jgi:hypothetical protein